MAHLKKHFPFIIEIPLKNVSEHPSVDVISVEDNKGKIQIDTFIFFTLCNLALKTQYQRLF